MAGSTEGEDWREQARLAGWHPQDEELPDTEARGDGAEVPQWMLEAQAAGWSAHAGAVPAPVAGGERGTGPRATPRWAIAAMAGAAALVVIAGGLTALLVMSDGSEEPVVDRSPLKVTTAQKTVTTITRSAGPSGTAPEPSRDVPEPPGPVLVAYDGGSFTAKRPAGWTTVADGEQKDGYVESKWRNPVDSVTAVKINWTSGTTGTAYSSAAGVRAQASVDREVSFKTTNLAGQPAVQWVFEADGERRVDYFVNACGTGFAILGVSRPATFARYAATFRKVARSVAENATSCD